MPRHSRQQCVSLCRLRLQFILIHLLSGVMAVPVDELTKDGEEIMIKSIWLLSDIDQATTCTSASMFWLIII